MKLILKTLKNIKIWLTFVLREAEVKYYKQIFQECDSPRKTWKIINERINNVKTRNIPSHVITNEVVKITDERVMAEAFANHFKKIGRDLVDQISAGAHNHRKYIPNKIDMTTLCTLSSSWNFKKLVNSLKNEFSVGCDGMSTSLFKELAEVLSQLLLFIFNSCMKNVFFQFVLSC